jgi:hypothetical protein
MLKKSKIQSRCKSAKIPTTSSIDANYCRTDIALNRCVVGVSERPLARVLRARIFAIFDDIKMAYEVAIARKGAIVFAVYVLSVRQSVARVIHERPLYLTVH